MRLRTLFPNDSHNLYTLDKKCVLPEDVVSSIVPDLQKRGEKQLNEFLKSRLWNRLKAISDAVAKNGVQLSFMKTAQHSKKHDKIQSTRNKVALFSHFFFYCQTMDGYLEHFFSHKNQVYRPYLSGHGSL